MAHLKIENCDSWSEPETYWHLHWKMTFGMENSEVRIHKDGKTHFADVLSQDGVVIEMQNSPIKKKVISEREYFYGDKMIWIINGIHFKENFKTQDFSIKNEINRHFKVVEESHVRKGEKSFYWKYARRSWNEVSRPVFIDFGEDSLFWILERMGHSEGKGFFISKEKFINKYGGNYEYYEVNKNKLNDSP